MACRQSIEEANHHHVCHVFDWIVIIIGEDEGLGLGRTSLSRVVHSKGWFVLRQSSNRFCLFLLPDACVIQYLSFIKYCSLIYTSTF